MVDLSFLAKALAQSEAEAAKSNPYNTTNQVIDSVQWDPTQFGTGENLAGGAVKGILNGFFGGLSDDYQAGQKSQIMNVLGNMARGNQVARPEEMDLSVFAPLEQAGGLFALQKELEADDLKKASSVKQAESITAELAKRGVFITPEGKKLELFNPLQEKADEAAAVEAGKILGANKAWGGDVSKNPDSPQAKIAADKNKSISSLESEIRTTLKNAPIAQNYQTRLSSLQNVLANLNNDTVYGDLALINGFQKIQDPEGSVREGDVATISAAQDRLSKVYGDTKGWFSSDGRLKPQYRKQLAQTSANTVNSFGKVYQQYADENLGVVERAGGRRDNVPYVPHKDFDIESYFKSAPSGSDIAAAAAAELARRRSAK